MSRKLGLLETFAWACQRGTEDVLVLDVLERIYALCDLWPRPAARRRAISALEGYHDGLRATGQAELDEESLTRFRLAADVAHHALMLVEPNTGSRQRMAIEAAERFCLERFRVSANLRAGKASRAPQEDAHVRAWVQHVHEQDALWSARLRGEGEPLHMDPVTVSVVLEALGGPV